MSTVSSFPAAHRSTQWRRAIADRPLALALLLCALIAVLRLGSNVDSDVAWQLWIARRIHAGSDLYTDVIEVNPPLWFWIAVPIDRFAALVGVTSPTVLIPAVSALVALSLAATNQLIGHVAGFRRSLLLGYGALAL